MDRVELHALELSVTSAEAVVDGGSKVGMCPGHVIVAVVAAFAPFKSTSQAVVVRVILASYFRGTLCHCHVYNMYSCCDAIRSFGESINQPVKTALKFRFGSFLVFFARRYNSGCPNTVHVHTGTYFQAFQK